MAEQWHLDKKVPVSLIGAIILQTFVFGWMARGLDAKADANTAMTVARTSANERAIAAINLELDRRRPVIEHNTTSIAVLRTELENIKRGQDKIIELLEKERQ